MPVTRSNDAVIRRKQKQADITIMKSLVLDFIDEVQTENYKRPMTSGYALDLVAMRVREWRP